MQRTWREDNSGPLPGVLREMALVRKTSPLGNFRQRSVGVSQHVFHMFQAPPQQIRVRRRPLSRCRNYGLGSSLPVAVRSGDNSVRRQLKIFADDNSLTLLLERTIPPES